VTSLVRGDYVHQTGNVGFEFRFEISVIANEKENNAFLLSVIFFSRKWSEMSMHSY
jgi:hypothetical protein